MIEYKPYTKKHDLGEIYQVSGLRFALMSSKAAGNMQCHQWVKCRDFLGDVVRAWALKKPIDIYNFKYNPATDPKPYTRKLRLLVKHDNSKTFHTTISKAIAIINRVEVHMKVPKSKKVYIKDPKTNEINENVILLEANAIWIKSPALLSLFTLLIRISELPIQGYVTASKIFEGFEKVAKFKDEDTTKHYLHFLYDVLPLIVSNYKKIFFSEGSYDQAYLIPSSINNFHNKSGILSLVKGNYLNKTAISVFKANLDKLLAFYDYPVLKHTTSKPVYYYEDLNFSTITKVVNDKEYVASYRTTCREEFVNYLRNFIKNFTKKQLDEFMKEPTYYVGICTSSDISSDKNKLYYDLTLKYLNNLCVIAGFNPCTFKSCKVTYRNSKPTDIDFGFVVGMDRRWVKHPVLLTLLLVIVRNMPNYLRTSHKINGLDPLKDDTSLKAFKEVFKLRKPSVKYFNQARTRAVFIALKHTELFKDIPLSKAYFFRNNSFNIFRTNGVNALIRGAHFDKTLQARYSKELTASESI